MFNKKIVSIVLLSATSCYAIAKLPTPDYPKQPIQQTEQKVGSSSQTYSTITDSIQKKHQEDQASRWGITEQEWLKFEDIKKGPRGYWSPNLDPLTTLGVEAETDAERQRYAEIQVRLEFERAEKELAYQRTYTAAFQRLYPGRLPIENLGKTKASSVSTSTNQQRLTIFVRQNCSACDAQVKQLQKTGTGIDIYMVDSLNNDTAIRQWATKIGINPKLVLSKQITLNYGAKLWQQVGNKTDQLPVIYQEINGKLVKK